MTKLIVDGVEVDVPPDYTLLQAAEAAGAEIPRFCFHERLSIAGNCRMCLVELKGAPKPVASCAWAVRDCRPGPICDQGGECDLQDQAMAYGIDTTRFHENKRAVEDKYIGPLVKTSMNRCIHCTRCIRFVAEVAGVEDLGAINRGEDMEITTYLERAMRSELQANVADLCPVGALTHKPQSFNYRPWELSKTPSVDVMDAVGSAIRVDARGREVMRILPRVNETVNEEWISDKTRQVVDGLRLQRLDRPFVRENGRLRPATWQEAFGAIANRMRNADPKRVGALVGDLAAVEEIFALKLLMQSLGVSNLDCRQDGTMLHPAHGRASYVFNSSIAGIESADAILIVGSNPRIEASLINARIRKRWRIAPLPIGVIGEWADLTYDYEYLGAGPETLADVVAGRHSFAERWTGAQRPLVIVGQGAFSRPDGLAILSLAAQALGSVAEGWNGFNVLHTAAARVGALDLGFVPGEGGLDARAMAQADALDVIYNLGADEIEIAPGAFVIYQGTHGDRGAHRADVILPGAAYTEKGGTYVNTEGRVQLGNRGSFPPGEAREDWAILRALSDVLGRRLPFDSLLGLRQKLYAAYPHFAGIDDIRRDDVAGTAARLAGLGGTPGREPFASPVLDFYLTNPIARASGVMAECSAIARGRALEAAE